VAGQDVALGALVARDLFDLRVWHERSDGVQVGVVCEQIDLDARRHPFEEPDRAALADDARLLRLHAAGLVEAVVKIREQHTAVTDGVMDLVDEAAGWPLRLLRRHDFARPKPHAEEIEEMDAVLDENAAADLRLPKPVPGVERGVAGVVFEERMQRRAEQAGFEDAGDGLVQWIVAHDEVDGEKAARRPRGVDHAARVCQRGGQRLFTEHMLACAERSDGELAVRRGWRRDVDDLHLVADGECVDVRADRTANSSPVLRAASGIVSATAAARRPGIAANSRRQKRPNAPHPSSPTPSFAPGIIGFERRDVSVSGDLFMALEYYAPLSRSARREKLANSLG
jgi:hypothetical protein